MNKFNLNEKNLTIYHCGYEKCDSSHSYGPAVRDHFLIHFLVSGKGEFISDKKVYKIKKNDGFLIEPSKPTIYKADPNEPYEYYWVGFNGTDAKNILQLAGLDSQNPIFTYDCDNNLLFYLKNIYAESAKPVTGEFTSLGNLYLFLSCLIQQSASFKKKSSNYESTLTQAINFIHGNYSRDITVEDIAKFVKVERTHLFRVFKKGLELSPQQFLIHYRLDKSKDLLGKHGLNISQVAYSVGYYDPAHFSRLFKSKFGITPSQYILNET